MYVIFCAGDGLALNGNTCTSLLFSGCHLLDVSSFQPLETSPRTFRRTDHVHLSPLTSELIIYDHDLKKKAAMPQELKDALEGMAGGPSAGESSSRL